MNSHVVQSDINNNISQTTIQTDKKQTGSVRFGFNKILFKLTLQNASQFLINLHYDRTKCVVHITCTAYKN